MLNAFENLPDPSAIFKTILKEARPNWSLVNRVKCLDSIRFRQNEKQNEKQNENRTEWETEWEWGEGRMRNRMRMRKRAEWETEWEWGKGQNEKQNENEEKNRMRTSLSICFLFCFKVLGFESSNIEFCLIHRLVVLLPDIHQ